MRQMPLDVECPFCGAPIDHSCNNGKGYTTATHQKRWKAIGIAIPNAEDRHADYSDWLARKAELDNRAREAMQRRLQPVDKQ